MLTETKPPPSLRDVSAPPRTMVVMVLPVDGPPELRAIGTDFRSMQRVVNGPIACAPLRGRPNVDVWFNEEFLSRERVANPHASKLPGLDLYGEILGPLFVARETEEAGETISLTDEDVAYLQALLAPGASS